MTGQTMSLRTLPYREQKACWPATGRYIMAQWDDESIVVYQAYRREIGRYAAMHGQFGGTFSLQRMSWIKPNFLWMMFRCGWATKPDQETVLAVRLKRTAFDLLLSEAVPSSYAPDTYSTHDDWSQAIATSDVRLQWDPDHSPSGGKLERRAIQLGLRGARLRSYAGEWLLGIEDITDFVREQRERLRANGEAALILPVETPYPVSTAVARHLGMDRN